MSELKKKLFSLPKHGAWFQFFLAIVLTSVLPVLTLIYVMMREDRQVVFSGFTLYLLIFSVLGLMILGYAILFKYPGNIVRLHRNLLAIVRGEMPESVNLIGVEDDIGAIEKAVNVIIEQLKERIEMAETQKKSLERELYQANRLKSMGVIAAGIVHEINTPVQFVSDNTRYVQKAYGDIFGFVDLAQNMIKECRRDCSKAEALVEMLPVDGGPANMGDLRDEITMALSESMEGLDRIVSIVRAMRDFAHMGKQEKLMADINKIIKSAVTISRSEWKYVAEIEYKLDATIPAVECYPGDVTQVLLNLIINATHAIGEVCKAGPSGTVGKITIASRMKNNQVVITVSDTGGGIPEVVRPRIFEPFFTTKEYGDGTGQGLAISRSIIVNKHGGSLTFETEAGKGTTFIVCLPLKNKEKNIE